MAEYKIPDRYTKENCKYYEAGNKCSVLIPILQYGKPTHLIGEKTSCVDCRHYEEE